MPCRLDILHKAIVRCSGNSLVIYQKKWNVSHIREVHMAYNHVTESIMTNIDPVMDLATEK